MEKKALQNSGTKPSEHFANERMWHTAMVKQVLFTNG